MQAVTGSAVKPIGEENIPKPGERVLSKYRVERVIGEGGMGVVLAIRHTDLGELFAMKLLRPSSAERPGATARFVREARAAARLRSDHVARVYDVGTLPTGTPYMLMEHLDGLDLASILAAHGPLKHPDVVDYIGQALDAIGEAHSLGLVHRDLKPGNLFLSAKPSGAASLKVLDFGISKELFVEEGAPSMTQSGDLVGSPYYMSPEQMRGARDVDTRADIWALGVIMYELLTDTVPFPGKTSTQVCSAVLEGPLPSIRALVPDLPDELASIVSKCLRRERAQRFESAEDLSQALARVPRSFDGSRSSRTRKLITASRPPPSAGKASLASITLTRSALTRTSPGLGGSVEEKRSAAYDGRAEPATPPRGVEKRDPAASGGARSLPEPPSAPSAAPESSLPENGELESASIEHAAPDGGARSEGRDDSLPDSLPRASLPGVSEVPAGELDEVAGLPKRSSIGVWALSATAVVLAAGVLVYVLGGSKPPRTDPAASPSSPHAAPIAPAAGPSNGASTATSSEAAEHGAKSDSASAPSSSPLPASATSSPTSTLAAHPAGAAASTSASASHAAPKPSSSAPAASASSATAKSPSAPPPDKPAEAPKPPENAHEGIY